jgi:hypothetical protein
MLLHLGDSVNLNSTKRMQPLQLHPFCIASQNGQTLLMDSILGLSIPFLLAGDLPIKESALPNCHLCHNMLYCVQYQAPVAQWTERLTSNQQAAGSSPAGRAKSHPLTKSTLKRVDFGFRDG